MDRLMPFDELNVLSGEIKEIYAAGAQEQEREGILDSVLDLLVLSYVYGNEAANEMLGTSLKVDKERLDKAVTEAIAGETWVDRVSKYISSGTAEDVIRVIETDSHRIYNEAIYDIGKEVEAEERQTPLLPPGGTAPIGQSGTATAPKDQKGVIYKTWETMLDDRVRDTHRPLEMTKIPFDEYFYTYDGDYALRPGGFIFPENNINCRCRLRLSR